MLNGLLIALGLGGGWAWVRLLRGRAVAWLGIPGLAMLFAGGAWALSGRIGVISALTPLLSLSLLACGGGAGLGAAVHSDWNTRRRLGLSLALLVLSAEGALLLAWLGKGLSENASPSLVLGFAGLSLALVSFRQGVFPEQVRWRAGLRGSVALCAVLGVGLWWWHCESLALALLAGDLVANVSHQSAWAVLGAAGIAGTLLLGAAAQPWVRRFGAGLLLVIGILIPLPTLAMRWVVQERCEEHLPQAAGLFDASVPDPPIQVPAGWCRAPLTASLECPRTPTLYQQGTGSTWAARRLKADPLDTLWGQRWTRPGSVKGQTIRRDFGGPHLGPWLVSGGNREPLDLDGTLEDLTRAVQSCGLSEGPAPAMVFDMVIADSGKVLSTSLRSASSYSSIQQACLTEQAKELEFPVSTCMGDQRLLVPIYAGNEAD